MQKDQQLEDFTQELNELCKKHRVFLDISGVIYIRSVASAEEGRVIGSVLRRWDPGY